MLQQVLQSGDYNLFTQAALVLFFLAFVILLTITFIRPRSQTDRWARMPLADDHEIQPITPRVPRVDGARIEPTGDTTS